jgi:hypothetical protein
MSSINKRKKRYKTSNKSRTRGDKRWRRRKDRLLQSIKRLIDSRKRSWRSPMPNKTLIFLISRKRLGSLVRDIRLRLNRLRIGSRELIVTG